MGVVATSVHDAGLLIVKCRRHFRSKWQTGLLGNRKRIDIGTQRHHRMQALAPNQGHDTGMSDARFHIQPQLPQVSRNFFSSLEFPVAQLRISVKILPPIDQLRLDILRRLPCLGQQSAFPRARHTA